MLPFSLASTVTGPATFQAEGDGVVDEVGSMEAPMIASVVRVTSLTTMETPMPAFCPLAAAPPTPMRYISSSALTFTGQPNSPASLVTMLPLAIWAMVVVLAANVEDEPLAAY